MPRVCRRKRSTRLSKQRDLRRHQTAAGHHVDDKAKVTEQIDRNDGKTSHVLDIAADSGKGEKHPASLPTVGPDNALLAKIEPAKDAKINSLPVPERKLGLDLARLCNAL